MLSHCLTLSLLSLLRFVLIHARVYVCEARALSLGHFVFWLVAGLALPLFVPLDMSAQKMKKKKAEGNGKASEEQKSSTHAHTHTHPVATFGPLPNPHRLAGVSECARRGSDCLSLSR